MKAIICPSYGSPDVLELRDIEQPTPKDNEVLIKIQAAACNAADWHRLRADPFFVRLSDGLMRPKNPRLGADALGTVEAVGARVTQFKVGDRVYGEIGNGAFAEYAAVPEHLLAHAPSNLGVDAAAIPLSGMTALQGIRDSGQVVAGEKVLINGASGGVGTFAVQIAKALGAEVTGVCSGANADMVRRIGADHVIDYTQEDFTQSNQRYDLVFDIAANRRVNEIKHILTPQGRALLCGFSSLLHMIGYGLQGKLASKKGGYSIGIMPMALPKQADLLTLCTMAEAEQIKPVIDRYYPLEETANALRHLETGRAKGKIVITIET
ncbi:NAD(P)-dependent alcohol dehydrogenase [Salinispirillum marinum]|uniref:NAD(P)-dependent alcohol dehydrogenase n=2 Tax=Saccharospirillaceae TaxID=255527 RepID=A0ABV8BEC7_9GAMM